MLGMIGRNPKKRKRVSALNPNFPTGADGALSLNGITLKVLAGSTKQWTSGSIIGGGILEIVNAADGGDTTAIATNDGSLWTYLGFTGNLTINTGGFIRAIQNGFDHSQARGHTYTQSTPTGAQVASVSYVGSWGLGGEGGSTNAGEHSGGFDSNSQGHGGGGAGSVNGGNTFDDVGWGQSGVGGDNSEGASAPTVGPFADGFSHSGIDGIPGEETSGAPDPFYGGGASGGTRGYGGGGVYIQVNGTLTVNGVTFIATGQPGGSGATGGDCNQSGAGLGSMFGGGGSGGGGGGGGGKYVIRYHAGSASSANCDVGGGVGGPGGGRGIASGGAFNENGADGSDGEIGPDGDTDIASF